LDELPEREQRSMLAGGGVQFAGPAVVRRAGSSERGDPDVLAGFYDDPEW